MPRIIASSYFVTLLILKYTVNSFYVALPKTFRLSNRIDQKFIIQSKRLYTPRSSVFGIMSIADNSLETDQSHKIEVYSTLGCKYCRMAKFKLDELGISYYSIDVTDMSLPTDGPNSERQVPPTK